MIRERKEEENGTNRVRFSHRKFKYGRHIGRKKERERKKEQNGTNRARFNHRKFKYGRH